MSLTTSVPINQMLNTSNDNSSMPKNFAENQPRTSHRSFGRELGNLDAKVESAADTSKEIVQKSVGHKENQATVPHSSGSNDGALEKAKSVQPQKKEEDEMIIQDTFSSEEKNKALDETDDEELAPSDLERINNPQFTVEYVRDIFAYMRESEEKRYAQVGYLSEAQGDINEKMRAILVDWLVDVHIKFKLLPETLFLTINIVDRYLEKAAVARQKLQLVGVGAMLIAAKYEEIYPPEVKEFEYVTDRAYSKPEILDIEGKIICALNFNITVPTSLRFLERYALIAGLDEKMLNMTKYLLELSLVEYKMLKYTPSLVSCSAIYLINKISKKEGWSSVMATQSKYTETQLRPCAKDLCIILQNVGKSNLQAVRRKFSTAKYTYASKIQLDKA